MPKALFGATTELLPAWRLLQGAEEHVPNTHVWAPPPGVTGSAVGLRHLLHGEAWVHRLSKLWVSAIRDLSPLPSPLGEQTLHLRGLPQPFLSAQASVCFGWPCQPHRMQAGAMGLVELVNLLCAIPHAWLIGEAFQKLRCAECCVPSPRILWGSRGQRDQGGAGCGCICNVFFLIF